MFILFLSLKCFHLKVSHEIIFQWNWNQVIFFFHFKIKILKKQLAFAQTKLTKSIIYYSLRLILIVTFAFSLNLKIIVSLEYQRHIIIFYPLIYPYLLNFTPLNYSTNYN